MLIFYYFTFIYLLFLTFINKILVLLFCNRSIIFSLHLEVNGFAVFHSAFHSSRQKKWRNTDSDWAALIHFFRADRAHHFCFLPPVVCYIMTSRIKYFRRQTILYQEEKKFAFKKRTNQILFLSFFPFHFFFSMETKIINLLSFFYLFSKGIKIFNVASLLPSVHKFYHLTSIANDTFPSLVLN